MRIRIEGLGGLYGTKVYIGNHLVPHVRNVVFSHGAGQIPTLKLELLTLEGIDVVMDGVQVELVDVSQPDHAQGGV